MERRKAIGVVVLALGIAGAVRADMVQMPAEEVVSASSVAACDHPDQQPPKVLDVFADPAPAGLDLLSGGYFPETQADVAVGKVDSPQPALVLSDRQDSLSLCLYAMFTLGLCRSAPWVKKLSFGVVPGWYHDGGPFQIGHSHAADPDCLISAPVYCFLQPDSVADDPTPQYRQGTVVSLWRTSQFTPSVLASRGPPSMS
jgi:hypothetical protein